MPLDSPDVIVQKRLAKRVADVGSSKKSKKKRKFIDLVNEDESECPIHSGLERKGLQFLQGENHHICFNS